MPHADVVAQRLFERFAGQISNVGDELHDPPSTTVTSDCGKAKVGGGRSTTDAGDAVVDIRRRIGFRLPVKPACK